MESKFEEYKKKFIKENCVYQEEISFEEYDKLDAKEKKDCTVDKAVSVSGSRYYKNIPYDFHDIDELKLFIEMSNLEKNKKINKSIDHIEHILIVWVVISVLFLILGVYTH